MFQRTVTYEDLQAEHAAALTQRARWWALSPWKRFLLRHTAPDFVFAAEMTQTVAEHGAVDVARRRRSFLDPPSFAKPSTYAGRR